MEDMIRNFIAPLILAITQLQGMPVYIGTNTGGSGSSKGIYRMDFNPQTGKLSEPLLVAEYSNPGFLALHPKKPVLFAVGQPKTASPDGSGSVAAFQVIEDRPLEFIGEASSGGKGPCHLAVDATGNTVAIANYGDGTISTVKLAENGKPGEIATLISNKGSGPNKSRQEGPHAHGVYFDQVNKHLFVPDLGLDQVLIYPFDAATSKLGPALPSLATAAGAGPRHMAFTPDEKQAYVINELDSTVLPASHHEGKLTALAAVPALPGDFTGKSTTAEIEVHPGGKFVYASNRGHDSIAVFQRDAGTGALTLIQHAPCGGKTPRHFKIDPSGAWLLCAHQNSNTISVLGIDTVTGLLGAPSNTVAAPNPICLLFAPAR